MIDLICDACERSFAPRFPDDDPAYCDACDDEFRRELKAGHVTHALTGQVFMPYEGDSDV